MTRLAAVVAVLLVFLAGQASASAERRAYLTLARSQPLTVLGHRFVPGERVRVTAKTRGGYARMVAANRSGWFRTSFPEARRGRCDALLVVAVGSRGSRAVLKLQAPACQIDRSP